MLHSCGSGATATGLRYHQPNYSILGYCEIGHLFLAHGCAYDPNYINQQAFEKLTVLSTIKEYRRSI
jgi:hypothetical protein